MVEGREPREVESMAKRGGEDRRRILACLAERRVYQEDCQRVLLKAIDVAVALYGPDGKEVAGLCEMMESMQRHIAEP